MKKNLTGRAVFLTVGFFALCGCSSKKPEESLPPVEVSGRVVGKTIQGVQVVLTFHPKDERNKHIKLPTIVTEKTGQFKVQCPPGGFKITWAPIAKRLGSAEGPSPGDTPKDEQRPDRYRNPESTPWDVVIPPEGKKDLVLQYQPVFVPIK